MPHVAPHVEPQRRAVYRSRVLAIMTLLLACKRTGGAEPNNASQEANDGIATENPELDSDTATSDAGADATAFLPGGALLAAGVAECTSYVRTFGRCIESTVPEAARESVYKQMESSVTRRSDGAAAGDKQALAAACREAYDEWLTAMSGMGCDLDPLP